MNKDPLARKWISRGIAATTGVLLLVLANLTGDWLKGLRWGENQILDGVLGGPHTFGTAEYVDRPITIALIVIGSLIAYSVQRFLNREFKTQPRRATHVAGAIWLLGGLILLLYPNVWIARPLILWILLMTPWRLLSLPKLETSFPPRFHFWMKWVGAPLLIYAFSYRNYPMSAFEYPHEGDIFNAAQDLLNGKVPYRDTFIPHGIGNAFIGTLGLRWIDPTIAGFRKAYALTSPLNPVLYYFLFLHLLRTYWLNAALLGLAAHILSGLHLPFLMGHITWFGGIRTVFTLLTCTIAAILIRHRNIYEKNTVNFIAGTMLLSLTSSISLLHNMENGIACLAFVTVLLGLLSFRSMSYGLIAIPIYYAGFMLFALLLFSAFGPIEVISLGILEHVFVFPRHFALFFGLPLFSGERQPTDWLLLFYPIATLSFAIAVVALRWRSIPRSPTLLFLLPTCALAFVTLQISILRSDTWHLRVGIATVGIPFMLLLLQLNDRKSLTRACALLISVLILIGSWKNLGSPVAINLETPIFPLKRSIEGDYGVLIPMDQDTIVRTNDFLVEHPELGDTALFLTDAASILKIFLPIKDVSHLTLFHYLMTEQAQRETIAKMKQQQVRMVFYSQSTWHNDIPQFARRPILAQYINRNYSPCADVGKMVSVLVRKDLLTHCPLTKNQRANVANFPEYHALRKLPAFLGGNLDQSPDLEDLETLELTLKEAPSVELTLQMKWHSPCLPTQGFGNYGHVSFDLMPGRRRYLIPTTANPNWNHCPPAIRNIGFTTNDGIPFAGIQSIKIYVKRKRGERLLILPQISRNEVPSTTAAESRR